MSMSSAARRDGPECSLLGCLRRADECDDRPVGGSTRIDVEQLHTGPLPSISAVIDVDDVVVSALGEIGDAFDEFHTTSLGLQE